jgi:hypothetical protein
MNRKLINTKAMKKQTPTIHLLAIVTSSVVITLLLQIMGCGSSDPAPSAQDAVKAKLTSGKWNMQTAQVDGVDKTATYAGLSVTFTSTSYSTTNGKALWPASGSWSFVDAAGKKVKREDGTEIDVEVTDTSLKLSFSWTKTNLGGGRVESIAGKHVLSFTK